jgi:hypothetical protein
VHSRRLTSFYLDPTHERPLRPDLLKFLAQYDGFARIKIVRLQEPAALRAKASITCNLRWLQVGTLGRIVFKVRQPPQRIARRELAASS